MNIVFSILILVIIILMIWLVSKINNKIKLKEEGPLFLPIGKKVEVNNHKINIYSEGEGKATLVFMAGSGICSPVLDFKGLYSIVSKDYKIAVIEKAGYGFSDITNEEKDIDIILEEMREGLFKLDIRPPFILCPHSMSGIEAIYWAQKYPKEIIGMIGLDAAVPKCYENFNMPNINILKIISYINRIGLTRFTPSILNNLPAIQCGCLSNEEIEIYKAVFYRRTLTKDMINEVRYSLKNIQKVKDGKELDIPILFFISNGDGTGIQKNIWKKILIDYTKMKNNRKAINLYCGHSVHNYEPINIAMYSKVFIEEFILY